MQSFFRVTAWLVVAALVFVTLSPIDLRPSVAPANVERALAYGTLGMLFALAYPCRWLVVLVGVVALAAILELGQGLTLTRHGRLADFVVKGGAAMLGTGLAIATTTLVSRRARS
ncbi:hypothetical protein FV232_00790 [Methylobacterium sp. WL30]|uniref:hypothetical protein n=1 Tax=unclassified Methylobacterium TaxID=2615210 RepID=UPI0011C8A5D2|nr:MULTISPECIES: hypothetical protein [unclassified Methylobacterium]TXM94651.1 hypothetical protein FV223_03945 [Methylobacterium sp. WL116]TXN41104.1 hypothetical protein FV225_03895 [Methylobacterium sp. WL93]TXN53190.1 hypothetical protein FV227_00795 [Methylobacterium sp. WL119]TXN70952.1 hypothetical protein FV232_00790 [Methylobacterium sp. WL30]